MIVGLVAGVGVLCGALSIASATGMVQSLIVVSGSMSPGIPTGALLITVPKPSDSVRVGDVISVPSPVTQRMVTHRVAEVSHSASGVTVVLKGDRNSAADPEPYHLESMTLVPVLTLPIIGHLTEVVLRPVVLVPLGIAMVALVLLSSLSITPAKSRPKHAPLVGQDVTT